MHEQSLPNVDDFRKKVHEFDGLWKSLLIRVAWASVQGIDMVLFLHASLETKDARKLPRPRHNPKVQDFNTIWEARSVDDLDPFLDDLKRDVVQTGGRTLRIGLFDGNAEKHNFSSSSLTYRSDFSKHGTHSEADPSAWPRVSLEMSLNEIERISMGIVRPELLKERWNALTASFVDLNDVLREYFGIDRPPSANDTHGFVRIVGRIPIMFSVPVVVKRERMILEISAPETATLGDIKLSRVVARRKGKTLRNTVRPKAKEWVKRGDRRLYRVPESTEGVARFWWYLRYKDVILDELQAALPAPHSENPVLVMHSRFDPHFEYFESGLEGRSKHDSAFEHAVGWLLAFCGLAPVTYGAVKGLKKSEVDHFVYAPQHGAFIGVECTSEQPNIKDKLSKLYQRCQDVQAHVGQDEVFAAIASRLTLHEIPPTERDIAAKNEVALLTIDKLRELFNMAKERRTTGEMLDYIIGCIPRDDSAKARMFGNLRRALRVPFARS